MSVPTRDRPRRLAQAALALALLLPVPARASSPGAEQAALADAAPRRGGAAISAPPRAPARPAAAPSRRQEGGDPGAAPPALPATPVSVFDAMKGLAGTWIGKSTRGWEEEITLKVIAGGSVLVLSSFDAHPGEEMLTTYYMDGGELQLTHYCIAKNQPRLAATEIAPDGRQVTFTFRDATNLPSRDRGHMDRVVYRFNGPDSFSSRWTWYQDGKESWMEEIHYRRIR